MDPIHIPPVMLALIYQHHGSYGINIDSAKYIQILHSNVAIDQLGNNRVWLTLQCSCPVADLTSFFSGYSNYSSMYFPQYAPGCWYVYQHLPLKKCQMMPNVCTLW